MKECLTLLFFRTFVALFIIWASRAIFMQNLVQTFTTELLLALRKSTWIPWDAGGSPRRAKFGSSEQPTNHPIYGRAYSPMPEYSDREKYYYEKHKQGQHVNRNGHGFWQHGELRWEVSYRLHAEDLWLYVALSILWTTDPNAESRRGSTLFCTEVVRSQVLSSLLTLASGFCTRFR